MFSITMVDGWGCFCAEQRLLKNGFWSCGIWCGDDEAGFSTCMAIWNVFYCLRMCMLDNRLQTFFNLVSFQQQLCGREVCETVFRFAACGRLTLLWNLMLQHGACQQGWEKQSSTAQRLTNSQTAYFACFRVLREKGGARSSENLSLVLTCVFLQVLSASPHLHGPRA